MVGCEVEGSLWVVLGRSRGLCGRSWVALGASAGGLGPLLGPMLAVLGGLRPLLEPMLAILGRSWGSTANPGPLLGPLLPVLGHLGLKKVEEHDYLENVLISRAGSAICGLGAVLGRYNAI